DDAAQQHHKTHHRTKQVSGSVFESERIGPPGPDFSPRLINQKLRPVGIAETVIPTVEHAKYAQGRIAAFALVICYVRSFDLAGAYFRQPGGQRAKRDTNVF